MIRGADRQRWRKELHYGSVASTSAKNCEEGRRLFVAILLLSLYYDDYYYNEGNKNHRWASKGQEAGKRMGGLVGVCKTKTKHA